MRSFILIPLLLFVLYLQAGAVDRLEKYGVRVCLAILGCIGAASGSGDNPVRASDLSNSEIDALRFYRQRKNVEDWQSLEDKGLYLRFRKEPDALIIARTILINNE